MPSIINALTASGGGVAITGDATGNLALQTAGNTAVTIDTSQNVGVGTTSPTAKLDVNGIANATCLQTRGTPSGGFGVSRLFIQSETATIARSYSCGDSGSNYGAWEHYTATSTGSPVQSFRSLANASGDFGFNSGYGSAFTAYGCRAWVNFNGTGTPSIRASGNISSITDLGVGFYRINFTNALVDADYALVGTSRLTIENGLSVVVDVGDSTRSTTQATIQTIGGNSFGLVDSAYNNVSFFR